MSEIERVTSEGKEGELYEAEEIENEVLLLYEADKMLRLEKIRNNKRELKELNEKERKLRLKTQGEKKRQWILKQEEKSKLRLVQSLMRGIIGAEVDMSVKNFDMSKIKSEVYRIERIEKVREIKREWEVRMRLESVRKSEKERVEKVYRQRRCEQMVWECIEMSMICSERKQLRIEKDGMRYKQWC